MIYPWHKRKAKPAPKLRSRSEKRNGAAGSLDASLKAPIDSVSVIALTAYLELKTFTALSQAVEHAADLVNAEAVSLAAAQSLNRHHDLTSELIRRGADPIQGMEDHRAAVDEFFRRVANDSWPEMLLTTHVGTGLIFDFATALIEDADISSEMMNNLLDHRQESAVLVEVLNGLLEMQPNMSDRLALWGRRLVGDAILVCYRSVELDGVSKRADTRISSVLTGVIAAHSRRMDALGLTA